MQVVITEMEELSGKSSRSSESTIPVSAFQPRLLSNTRTRTRTFGQAVLAIAKIGASTGTGRCTMEEELEDKHVPAERQRAIIGLETATKQLLLAVTGREELDKLRQDSWLWYLQHLHRKVVPVWNALMCQTIDGLSNEQTPDDISAVAAVRHVMAEVAESLFGYGEVTLPDIVDHLKNVPSGVQYNEGKTVSLLRDAEGDLPTHLAFQTTGWLTGIWDPVPNVSHPYFRLSGSLPPRRRAGLRPDPIIRNIELSIKEWQNQPIHRVAARFGKLFPSPDLHLQDDTLGSRDMESACLTAAYISWHSLKDMVGVSLNWTGILAQHLEYDQQQKKLYVFKYPSICLLLCRKGPRTLLSDIFQEQHQEVASGQRAVTPQGLEFDSCLAEVLLSYPLIFARNSRSRKSIKKKLAMLGNECDPLLRLLCGKEDTPEMDLLYRELNAEPAENYVPIADFPFLARKLIQLQKLSMGRNPHSFRRLWRDRRNLLAWFALWAVLIITALTLIFQMLQLVFQIWTPAG
ncbi:hypothetical protein H2200_000958 [Cladophialophora chaetospira]|uniref:Uncharacterized protein n=1 Tax=Cladophialophora chaetospira TaxID=386627 RepID=A0AA38XPJ9_9EURO|nr:hypothetical protein H2200_000958 [Cladophialophora chaetospira]